jgi:hypothetical protein
MVHRRPSNPFLSPLDKIHRKDTTEVTPPKQVVIPPKPEDTPPKQVVIPPKPEDTHPKQVDTHPKQVDTHHRQVLHTQGLIRHKQLHPPRLPAHPRRTAHLAPHPSLAIRRLHPST